MFSNIFHLQGRQIDRVRKSVRRRAFDLFVAGAVILGSTLGTTSGVQAGPAQQGGAISASSSQIYLPMVLSGANVNSLQLPEGVTIDPNLTLELSDDLQTLQASGCQYSYKSVYARPYRTQYVGEYRASGGCSFVGVRLNRPGFVLVTYNRYGYWQSAGWKRIYPGQTYYSWTKLFNGTPIRVYVYNPYGNPFAYPWKGNPAHRYGVQIYR